MHQAPFPATILATLVATSAIAGVAIPMDIPRNSRVSLALYDAEGRMVQTLLTGKPLAKGKHSIIWDGLDRYGHALPAGDCTWKLLATEGLRAEFITQVGQNTDPVWEKATGNHQSPNAAAVDATGLYRQGSVNEGGHWGVKTDLNGRTLWVNDRNQADPWMGGGEALTLVYGRLFELMRDGTVYGSDATTGRVFTGSDTQPKPWNLRWESFVAPAGTSDDARRKRNIAERPHDLVGDTANELLVAAYPQHDAIAWFDARDGRQVDKAEGISGLVGIAVSTDGTVHAIAQGRVIALSRKDKTPRVLIAVDRLESPWRLAVSPKTGDLFVAENSDLAQGTAVAPVPDVADGKTPDLAAGVKIAPGSKQRHHQVKRFTPDGQLVKAFGRPEGRGDGVYVPTDFRGLTDIEADAEGGFVVTEGNHTPPRRTARFAADGTLLREWFGAQHYGIIVCPEPDDPRHVWFMANADQPALVRCEVDYEKKTWRVAEIYQEAFTGNPFARVPAIPTLFAHDDRIYIQGGGVQPGGLTLSIYDPVKKQLRPCNASSSRNKRNYLWNDLNDDGQATDDEVEWLSRNQLGGFVNPDDLLLVTTVHATGYQPGHLLAPDRLTASGTPVYASAQLRKQEPWVENGKKNFPYDCRRGPDGHWYACFADSFSNPNEGVENHGAWYYNSCSAFDRLVKWDKAWKPVWGVGRHSSDDDHETGSTAMPRGLVGFTHGCVVLGDASDEESARPSVWTEDGLFVDELLRVPIDTLRKEEYGEENTNEYPTGHLATDPRTGDTYYYALNSTGGSPIYRISGWEGWHHASGKIKLAAAATQVAKRDGTGLKGEYFNTPDCTGEPVLARTDPLVFFYWFAGKDGWPKGIKPQAFSCRWTGQVEAPTTEVYRFVWESYAPWRGEGWGTPGKPRWLKLSIGGNLILDTDAGLFRETTFGLPQAQGIYADVPLQAGERYDLRLEAGFATNAVARFCWETPALDRRAILPEFFHPEPGPKRKLETPNVQRPEVIADFGFEEKKGVLSWSRAGGDVFGRLTGNARRVPGKTGRAIELQARGEFEPALFPIDEELRLPDTDYTVAFWFKTTAKDVRVCEAKRYSSYNNRWSDHVVSLNQGKVRFQLHGDRALETPRRFNDGQWHHVVTTVGPGGQRLHVDGTLIATGQLARRTKTSNRLGLDLGPGGGHAVVTLDDLRVFGRALMPGEIARLLD
ncbi:MAG: LamG-like jellyroll fold domain-containing protein [Verrucomicrobiia bacterium]